MIIPTAIFIASHGASADHFATFVENLPKSSVRLEIYASGPALKKFQERGIEVKKFTIDNLSSEEEDALADQIAKACSSASVVITDVGHSFDAKVHKSLSQYAFEALRLAYYDNPEPFVPGGYSKVAAQVMLAAQGILFANSNLAKAVLFLEPGKEIDLADRLKIGLGYYPVSQAEKIVQRRAKEQIALRRQIYTRNGIGETGQKTFVYFGGNNDEYFGKAFPAFLQLLSESMLTSDLSDLVFIIQQHPAAKVKNLDGRLVAEWIKQNNTNPHAPKIIVSDFSSDDAQVVAEGAFYYQTSMGPQFVLAGIPVVQIGHETYEDVLVRNQLCSSVTQPEQLEKVIVDLQKNRKKEFDQKVILDGLGIKQNWLNLLQNLIVNPAQMKSRAVISFSNIVEKHSISTGNRCSRLWHFIRTDILLRIAAIFRFIFRCS